ncbi:UNKNOWN [Stylonychia lemnae]|uniref:Major facilitator superfamily (MFS) profile domain-containing protein n=1 Tax=Stylonychia lemnae TaxID=5949 RepID=A0A077ZT77_STYLE|nr:UNKNOWN [Stylonychia lemnae]|eukprot:CDW73087.1 UNKNOWN [Stylonychia lemnae]
MKETIIFKNSKENASYHTFQENQITSDSVESEIKSEQKRMIFALIICCFVVSGQYGCIGAFFIPYKVKNHPSISDFQVGLLLAFFEVGTLVSNLFVSNVMAIVGRKNTILLALSQSFLASIGIGSSSYIQDEGQVLSYLEAGIGIGFMLGAPIGQTFSILMSYPFIFFGFGILLIFPFTLSMLFLPRRINQYIGDQDSKSMDIQDAEDISYGKILRNKKVLYIISGILVDKVENSYLVQSAFITSTLSLYLQGTSKFFNPPVQFYYGLIKTYRNSVARVIIGIVLADLSVALLCTSFLPNIIKAVEEKEDLKESNDQLMDKASTLYILSYTFSCLIAPLLGGYLSDNFGYNKACDLMGMTLAFLAILYFVVNILIKNLKA